MCILREEYNKIIVTRWFAEYWGENYNPATIAELAAPGNLGHVPFEEDPVKSLAPVELFLSGETP